MNNKSHASTLAFSILLSLFATKAFADTGSCWANNPKTASSTVTVTNASELQNELLYATAGTHILLEDGIYTDIALNVSNDGTPDNPIVIRAINPGQASLEGNTTSQISGDYVVLSGLKFRNGNIATDLIRVTGANDCISEIDIEGYTASVVSRWVMFKWGAKNGQVEYSRFHGKSSPGAIIQADFGTLKNGTIDWPRNHKFDHNYFSRPPVAVAYKDAGEAIRIGHGAQKDVSAQVVIEQNLFDKSDGELEIISIKATNVMVRNNTFLNSAGKLSFRHGSDSAAIGNYFIVNDTSATYSSGNKRHYSGINAYGSGHFIANNHFEGTFTTGVISSDKEVAVTLQSCDDVDPAQDINFFHNTIVQKSRSGYAINWGNCQSESLFANNILNAQSSLLLGDIDEAPSFKATIAWSEDGTSIPSLSGLISGYDPQLTADTALNFEVPAVNDQTAAELPTVTPVPGFGNEDWSVTKDIIGRSRDDQPDIGNFEIGVSGSAVKTPLTERNVGPGWIFHPTQGISFDGVDDYLDLADIGYGAGNKITIALWVKYAAQDAVSWIVRKSDYGSKNPYYFRAYNGTLSFRNANSTTSSVSNVSDNSWCHIAMTYDGSTMKTYLDGVLQETIAHAPVANITSNIARLGGSPNANPSKVRAFKGSADDLRFYDTDLSEAQILTIAQAPHLEETAACTTVSEPNLVAFWPMADGATVNTCDVTGNFTGAANGKIVGASWNN